MLKHFRRRLSVANRSWGRWGGEHVPASSEVMGSGEGRAGKVRPHWNSGVENVVATGALGMS